MNCAELQQSLIEIEDGSSAVQQAHLKICPECSALVDELNLISSSATELQATDEPSPRVWNSIETAIGQLEAELNLIAASATGLRAADEPSPRVWNSIETAVRQVEAELNLIAASATELRAADEPSPRVWNSIEIALRQEGLIRPPRANRSLIPSFSSRWGWARWMVPAAAVLLITVGIYLRQHSLPSQLASHLAPTTATSDLAIAGLNDDDLLQEISEQSPAMKAQYEDNLRRVNEYIQDAKGELAASPNDAEARRSLDEAYQEKAMLFELAMDRSLP
jgi:hypothetical protein